MSLLGSALAQSAAQSSTVCSFEDGKELTIRYEAVSGKQELPRGRIWAPGGAPLYLFSQSDLEIGTTQVPLGAYSLYVIPDKESWTLVVNKNVTPHSKYDRSQDVARIPMPIAAVPQAVNLLQASLGRMGPRQCNLRFYYGKTAAYGAEFKEP